MAEVMICKHSGLGLSLVIQWRYRVGVWCVGSMEFIQPQAQKTCALKQGHCELQSEWQFSHSEIPQL